MKKQSIKYIALSLIMTVVLTINVGMSRTEEKKFIGYEKGTKLERAVRSHANFLEYTPIFLVALVAAECAGLCVVSTNVLGSAFLLGRVLHALSLNHFEVVKNCYTFRKAGMALTVLPFLILAIFLLVKTCKSCCKKDEDCSSESDCSTSACKTACGTKACSK